MIASISVRKGQHGAGFGDKGPEHVFVHFSMIEREEIGQSLCSTVFLALRGHLVMIGQPDNAAGYRRGPAKPILLFDQADRGAGFMRGQCRR